MSRSRDIGRLTGAIARKLQEPTTLFDIENAKILKREQKSQTVCSPHPAVGAVVRGRADHARAQFLTLDEDCRDTGSMMS